MNKAMKLAKKELQRAGSSLVYEGSNQLTFRMPDGSTWYCSRSTSLARVREVVSFWKARARRSDYLGQYLPATDPPKLGGYRLCRTQHFTDRCDLMIDQGMTVAEVHAALMVPDQVLAGVGDRFLYCSGRIAVVIEVDEVATAVTCLWATNELWEQNPRADRAVYE